MHFITNHLMTDLARNKVNLLSSKLSNEVLEKQTKLSPTDQSFNGEYDMVFRVTVALH